MKNNEIQEVYETKELIEYKLKLMYQGLFFRNRAFFERLNLKFDSTIFN